MGLIKDFRRADSRKTALVVAALSLSFALAGVSVWVYYRTLSDFSGKVWVVVGGQAYLSEKADSYDTPYRKYEYIQVAKEFYTARYSADKYTAESNLKRAMELTAGQVSEKVLTDWQDEGIYNKTIENGWLFTCVIDSVLTADTYLQVFGRQFIRTKSKVIERNLFIEMQVRDTNRSGQNPNGVQIEKLDLFNNQIIDEYFY